MVVFPSNPYSNLIINEKLSVVGISHASIPKYYLLLSNYLRRWLLPVNLVGMKEIMMYF
jgi:hypothetical protein